MTLLTDITEVPTNRVDLYNLSSTYQQRQEKRKEVFKRKKDIKDSLSKGHKLCTSCNEEKSLNNFNVDRKSFTGYSAWCKSCKKEYNKKYLKGYSNDEALG